MRRRSRPAGRHPGRHAGRHIVLGAIVASPTCEDGTAPTAQGCSDGSEPITCPAGSVLQDVTSGAAACRAADAPSPSGEFSCEADTQACAASTAEPGCEDGRSAVRSPAGSYTCADGSEPACEEAFTPVFAGDHLVRCEPGSEDEEEESEG